MDWLVAQADRCCGEWIMRIPLPVLGLMILVPGLILLGIALRMLLKRG